MGLHKRKRWNLKTFFRSHNLQKACRIFEKLWALFLPEKQLLKQPTKHNKERPMMIKRFATEAQKITSEGNGPLKNRKFSRKNTTSIPKFKPTEICFLRHEIVVNECANATRALYLTTQSKLRSPSQCYFCQSQSSQRGAIWPSNFSFCHLNCDETEGRSLQWNLDQEVTFLLLLPLRCQLFFVPEFIIMTSTRITVIQGLTHLSVARRKLCHSSH